jgi:hypothetical protein
MAAGGAADIQPFLDELERGPRYAFADWPTVRVNVPRRIGVYTIWNEADVLAYAGIAYVANPNRKGGLLGRLNSHASGQRSGDRFCIYISDIYVLPSLSTDDIAKIATGQLKMDHLVRDFVRQSLFFRWTATDDAVLAREIERRVRAGVLETGPPQINPLLTGRPSC